MTKTIAYVPTPGAAAGSVAWASRIAVVGGDIEGEAVEPVHYCCRAHGGGMGTVEAVRDALGDAPGTVEALPAADSIRATMERARSSGADLLLSFVSEQSSELAVESARWVSRSAPCASLVVLSGSKRPEDVRRVLAILTDSASDAKLFHVAAELASGEGSQLTVARIEEDVGRGAEELGQRELARFLRDVAAEDVEGIEQKVIVDNYPVRGALSCFDDHDVVLVGASSLDLVKSLRGALGDAILGVVRRQPPLKRRAVPDWIPQVNPSDYAELAQTLRHGSRWNADFVVMLGLASAIATLGLIQDSPAVVIGSMLLAPLMTPMLGFGLSLAQANSRLGRSSARVVALGFLLTLTISFVLGHLSFSETLSPQVLSRGEPNILDLGIALLAAVAAAFALARPSLSGAVAGVAIATALVPPVCACGISLAKGFWLNGLGAGLLFFTNLLAIVLASALSFLALGIAAPHGFSRARRRARLFLATTAAVLLLLCLPLGLVLARQVAEGRAQPVAYPLTRAASRALEERVEQEEGARIMLMGRESKTGTVVIYVASDRELSSRFRASLREIARREMNDPDVVVDVIVVRSAMGK